MRAQRGGAWEWAGGPRPGTPLTCLQPVKVLVFQLTEVLLTPWLQELLCLESLASHLPSHPSSLATSTQPSWPTVHYPSKMSSRAYFPSPCLSPTH